MLSGQRRRAIVDRDSVCAGDDCRSHQATFQVEGRCTVGELIRQARLASPLAGIAGGRATWLIDTQGVGRGCIGVVAQQWDQPQFLIPAETTVDQLFHDQDATVFFRYWGQSSPEAVLEALKSGAALPSRLAPLD